MPTTTTAPNLYQLGQEIGGNPPFRMVGPDKDGGYTVSSPIVSEPTPAAALAAHKPNPSIVAPPSPATVQEATETANGVTLRQQATQALATNRTYIASTPTAAQTTAQVKTLHGR